MISTKSPFNDWVQPGFKADSSWKFMISNHRLNKVVPPIVSAVSSKDDIIASAVANGIIMLL